MMIELNHSHWFNLIIWTEENPCNGRRSISQQKSQALRVTNRPLDQKPDFLGKKKTILGHFFWKSLLNRPKSVKTDHITHTGVGFAFVSLVKTNFHDSKLIKDDSAPGPNAIGPRAQVRSGPIGPRPVFLDPRKGRSYKMSVCLYVCHENKLLAIFSRLAPTIFFSTWHNERGHQYLSNG